MTSSIPKGMFSFVVSTSMPRCECHIYGVEWVHTDTVFLHFLILSPFYLFCSNSMCCFICLQYFSVFYSWYNMLSLSIYIIYYHILCHFLFMRAFSICIWHFRQSNAMQHDAFISIKPWALSLFCMGLDVYLPAISFHHNREYFIYLSLSPLIRGETWQKRVNWISYIPPEIPHIQSWHDVCVRYAICHDP